MPPEDNILSFPQTIFYGTRPLEIRFRSAGGSQTFFCLNNSTLHLTKKNFLINGTYPAASLLAPLCRKHCQPDRESDTQPCPAFVEEYTIGSDDNGLATVKLRATPQWELCGGMRKLLDEISLTSEERYLFLAYHQDMYTDSEEAAWRDSVVNTWNEQWHEIEEGWAHRRRRPRFEQALWYTVRFPAMIPQVWLNWLHAASEADQKLLDENPSRIDFMAFASGERHVVEIDGPSHYAAFDEVRRMYSVDEREYARNLKVARSLQRDGWVLTRIGRSEVRDAVQAAQGDGFDAHFETWKLLRILPFTKTAYPEQYTFSQLGLPELRAPFVPATVDDDIPF